MNKGKWILKFVLLGIVMMVVIGLVTQSLWNWLVPIIFNGPVLTFWQTLGLLVLSKILFWSFGKGGRPWHHRSGGPWGNAWTEKWQGMSPDERERFKQKMKDKWCYPDKHTPEKNSDEPTAV